MGKKIKIILIILVIILVMASIFVRIHISLVNKKYGYWIDNNDFLYDKAIEYLSKEEGKKADSVNKDDYQVFYDYEGFGIKEKDNFKYAYMYILEESYYVKHEKLRSDEKSCMPYKFIFENNEVIGYEIPKDGTEYITSIKEMFPDDIENKVIKYNFNTSKLAKKVDEYYSYLESTLIFHEDYNEEIIAICGNYNKNTSNSTNNVISGRCIDGYGDVYEFEVPYNENQEPLENINNIDKNVISKYQGKKVDSIAKDDLNIIKNNLSTIKENYSDIKTQDIKISFIKVLNNINKESNGNIIVLNYNNSDYIDLLIYTDSLKQENISESSKKIINILRKYKLSNY